MRTGFLSAEIRRMLAAAMIATLAGALAPMAQAATPPKHTAYYADSTPDISGVWDVSGGIYWDSDPKNPPPLTPPFAAIYASRQADVKAGRPVYDPVAACLPPGMPRLILAPYPMEIIQTPGRVTILRELMSQIRRIYTDGRAHPSDPDLTFNGHSIGHWEGETLVVDTVAMRGDTVLDRDGFPHSDQTHSVERYRRIDADTIEVNITLEDPKALTRPWTLVRSLKRHPDWEIIEYVCEENNRNTVDAEGRTGFDAVPHEKATGQ